MIVFFIFLGIIAVASVLATGLLVAHDSASRRPYCSEYDSRRPQ
ncbi:MAG TPA: hypothetical protein VK537_02695 [Galbitalea sp.]|nr:hypothetical protein [Galbitalea sp.]